MRKLRGLGQCLGGTGTNKIGPILEGGRGLTKVAEAASHCSLAFRPKLFHPAEF